jgi:RHS repeat-associated protein
VSLDFRKKKTMLNSINMQVQTGYFLSDTRHLLGDKMFNLNSTVTRSATSADFPQADPPAIKPFVLFQVMKKWAIAICVLIAFSAGHNPAAHGQTMPEGTIGWWALGDSWFSSSYWPDPSSACKKTALTHMGTELVKMVPVSFPGYDCWYANTFAVGFIQPYGSTQLHCVGGYVPVWPGICVRSNEFPRPIQCSNKTYAPTVGNPVVVTTGAKYEVSTDYASRGSAQLAVRRYYRSLNSRSVASSAGMGWTFNFDRLLWIYPSNGYVEVYLEDGTIYAFSLSNGIFTAQQADVQVSITTSPLGADVLAFRGLDDRVDHFRSINGKYRVIFSQERGGYTQSFTYDLNGLLQSITDSFGRTLTVSWQGEVVSTINAPGQKLNYTYDQNYLDSRLIPGSDRLISVTASRPDGSGAVTTSYQYQDPKNRFLLTGIQDENAAQYASFTYGPNSKAASTEHAGGVNRYQLNYDQLNSMTTVIDPLNSVRSMTYAVVTGLYKFTGASQPAGAGCGPSAQNQSYDTKGNVASKTDFNGVPTIYSYDQTRNLEISRTEAFGTPQARTIVTAWHPTFRLPVKISEQGRVTDYGYDPALGVMLSKAITDTATGKTRIWSYTYNTNGQVLTVDAPRTDVADRAIYTYDAAGNVATYANALGQVTRYTSYDANGRPLSMTDPNGLVTTMSYDFRGRIKTRAVGIELMQFDYDNVGQLIKVTQPDGSFVSYTYDAAHRLTDVRDSLANRIHYTLDTMGNRIREDVTDPLGNLVQSRARVIDALNRLQKDIGGSNMAGQITEYGYDPNGNLTRITDPLFRTTGKVYDARNRLVQVTDPNNGLLRYGYDNLDHLRQVTDPRSLSTSYGVDGLDNIIQLTSPDTAVTARTYDEAGNVKTATDARRKTTAYTYDALNRVTAMAFKAGVNVAFKYDTSANGVGRLASMTDESGVTAWNYSAQGRVAGKAQVSGGITRSMGYSYDTAGRLIGIQYPSGTFISYTYANNRISSITVNGATLLGNIKYHPFGAAKSWTWGNGSAYARTYDADGRVKTFSYGLSTKTISYDNAGRITGIADNLAPITSETFGYDSLDRITSYVQNTTSLGYSYDATGNRTAYRVGGTSYPYTVSATSNILTKVAGPTAQTLAYDAAGNLTKDATSTYTYSDRGRLASATSNRITSGYFINGLGQRVKKTVGANTNLFMYDEGGQLLGEYNSAGNALYETVYLDEQPVAVLKPDASGYKVYYLYADHLNTPRLITDNAAGAANKKVWQWDSDPFGITPPNENPAAAGVFTYNPRFPGQVYDKESGLHYNYFRDYNPGTGRYVQSDPIGLAGGMNTFGYVDGNPLSFADPEGLQVPGSWATIFRGIPSPVGNLPNPIGSTGQAVGATGDFLRNYNDMRNANTIGADKYFHCKANCEASRRGSTGNATACTISDAREWFDQTIKGDSASASEADQVANRYGRDQSSPLNSCDITCSGFRPNGLNSRY